MKCMSRKMLRDHAGAYFHLNFMFEATFIQDLFSKITVKLGFKFLDAGYGTVNTNTAVAKKVRDSGLVMRCDPDKSRTDIAHKKSFI